MSEAERIADELRRAYDGDPWHGPPLTTILSGTTAREAADHSIPAAHSIWEIVLHIEAWTDEVAGRLRGRAPGEPTQGDWPLPINQTEEAWRTAQADLSRANAAIIEELAGFPDARLGELVSGPLRDPAQGTGVSFYLLLHGLVQHNVYHSGQIAILRKALEQGRRG